MCSKSFYMIKSQECLFLCLKISFLLAYYFNILDQHISPREKGHNAIIQSPYMNNFANVLNSFYNKKVI